MPVANLVNELKSALGDDAVSDDPVDTLAYGHDVFPLALKRAASGQAAYRPDMVAFPRSTQDVAALMRLARRFATPIVPFGGGSGIVGGALPVRGGIVVDLKRLASIEELDTTSHLVTVGAGTNGQRLEDYLNERGFTTGHFPQSLRSSTVGGWIAHRATGTASTLYGGIEMMVAGLEVVLPSGDILSLRPSPRRSVGPELTQLFLGSEGTLGIVTQATLRVHPLPSSRRWLAYTFARFADGLDAVRHVVQAGYRPAVVRLYDQEEGAHLLRRGGLSPGSCLLLMSCEGVQEIVAVMGAQIPRIVAHHGAAVAPVALAEYWWEGRFNTVGLLQTLQKPAGVADALEIAAPWSKLADIYERMRAAMLATLRTTGHDAHVYGHMSHAYDDGGNLYMIFHGEASVADKVPALYDQVLAGAFTACIDGGGTLSHHHGVGLGKVQWLPLEYGSAGMRVLHAVKEALDPAGVVNPGKIGAPHDA